MPVIAGIILMFNALFSVGDTEEPVETEHVEEERIDYSDADLEGLIGQAEEVLEDTDFTYDEDDIWYQLLDGDVVVSSDLDGMINMVMITGNGKDTPSFHGVRLGMSLEEAGGLLLDQYVYEGEEEGKKGYFDSDSRTSVVLEHEDEIVTEIYAMLLTEEELEGYMEEEYIFPDSDQKYLSEDEIRSITVEDMVIGRNEIFARHGYIFRDRTRSYACV